MHKFSIFHFNRHANAPRNRAGALEQYAGVARALPGGLPSAGMSRNFNRLRHSNGAIEGSGMYVIRLSNHSLVFMIPPLDNLARRERRRQKKLQLILNLQNHHAQQEDEPEPEADQVALAVGHNLGDLPVIQGPQDHAIVAPPGLQGDLPDSLILLLPSASEQNNGDNWLDVDLLADDVVQEHDPEIDVDLTQNTSAEGSQCLVQPASHTFLFLQTCWVDVQQRRYLPSLLCLNQEYILFA